jgi:peptidoglycan-associated lipoprotein
MTRHSLTLLAAAAAVAVLAGCATPSTPTPAAAATPAPAPTPAAAPAAAPAAPAAGTTGGVAGGSSRSTALAPTPAPPPVAPPAPALPAQPESATVYFDFDDARLAQAGLATVERYGRYLGAVRAASARVEGHADERGSREYNLALGQRRAQSVVDALKVLGVADSRVEAVSYGEERPRVRASNEEAWAQNRRAELSIKR